MSNQSEVQKFILKPGQFRIGKTARDKRSGAHSRRRANQSERNAWSNDKNRTQATFPYHICNGKRNKKFKALAASNSLRFGK